MCLRRLTGSIRRRRGTMANNAVWKYTIMIVDSQTILLPTGAQILRVDFQQPARGTCLWCLCDIDPNVGRESRRILICGTGHHREDLDGALYINTFMVGGE